MDRIRNLRWLLLLGVALCTLTLAAFWGVRQCGFINYDDTDYVTQNPHVRTGLTWANVVWAFSSAHAGNWHPLTWLSHMLDCQLYGFNPAAHHQVNALVHTFNTLLVFLLLQHLTGVVWRSAFVAALFGLHPLHVESVAWIAERKDVLSAFFFLLILWAYLGYVRAKYRRASATLSPNASPGSKLQAPGFYALTLLLLTLGLMCKPMLVTVPFVLLLLDYWPLGRCRPALGQFAPVRQFSIGSRLLLEKVPFLVICAGSCVITFLAQRAEGAVATATAVPLGLRLANAPVSYVVYVHQLFWPADLIAYYPIAKEISLPTALMAVAALTTITGLAWALRRRAPYVAVGWLWYLGMLVPVIGLVQVGLQAHADRYTYLPYLGLFIALAWGIADLARTWRWRQFVLGPAALTAVGACFVLTTGQIRYWQNSEALFRHTLDLAPDNPVARLNLGSALVEQGKFLAAGEQFAEAVRLSPSYAEARSNLGFALAMQGKTDDAIACYRTALAINPRFERTHSLLAGALLSQGHRAEAITEYRLALECNPDWPAALNDLAWILATDPDHHDGSEAARLAERACRLTEFREPLFIGTLAAAYAEAGRFPDAVATATQAAEVAKAAGQTQIAQRNLQLIELYRAGLPCREPAKP